MRTSVIIRRKLNSLARRLRWTTAPCRPIRAWISPTTRCNLRCRTCSKFNGSVDFRDMSPETYAILKRELMPGLAEVNLTGVGEPLMAPLLPEMLDDAARAGAHVSLTTNGMIWDEAVAKRLVEIGARVMISVDGADADTMEAVRPGLKFGAFTENLERFADLRADAGDSGFELYFNVVMLRMNLDQLGVIADWAGRLGVDCVYFSNFGATGILDDFAGQSLERHPEIVKPVLDKVGARCDELGLRYQRPQFLSDAEGETKRAESGRLLECPLPWWGVYIEADGGVFPCCQWWPPIANIHDAPFGKVWNGEAYRKIRHDVNRLPLPESCQRCVLGERAF